MDNEQKVREALKHSKPDANDYQISQVLVKLHPDTESWTGWEFRNILNAVRLENETEEE